MEVTSTGFPEAVGYWPAVLVCAKSPYQNLVCQQRCDDLKTKGLDYCIVLHILHYIALHYIILYHIILYIILWAGIDQ
jgi:hypothetical protein